MKRVISRNSEVLGGTAVFVGTRVPVRILLEHFESGSSLDEFLEDYPTVSRDQATRFLEIVIANIERLDDEVAA